MQNITASLDTTLKNSAQVVEPSVEAEWVNGRSLTNVKAYSSSDDYVTFITQQNPVFYTRFNESFDVIDGMYTGPKPVTHWRMNNAANTLAVSSNIYSVQDESGYNNLYVKGVSGTDFTFGQTGVVQDNAGNLSTSLYMPGNAGYAVSSQKDTQNRWSIIDNPSFSVECWIKPTTINMVDGNFIIYKDSKGYLRSVETGEIQLSSSIPEWTLNLDSGNPKFIIYNSNTGYWKPLENRSNVYVDVKSPNSLVVNQWYHIVAVFDGKTLSLYVNNQLVGSNNVLNGTLMDTTSGSLYVGARYFDWTAVPGIDTSINTKFIGNIDEIAIYNNALNLEDIKQRWRTGSLNIGTALRSPGYNHAHVKDYSGKGRNPFIYNPSGTPTAFAGIDFRPQINGALGTPFIGRKDSASYYFNNGTSIINYQYLTSDNSATGTPVFDGTAKVTVAGWIYVEDKVVSTESIEMIAALGTPSGEFHTTATTSNGSWYVTLRRQTNGAVDLSGSIYNGTVVQPVTFNNIPRNQWVHFVFSVNSLNNAVIMINGNTSTVATSVTATPTMNTNSQWKLFIGGRQSNEGLSKCYISELSISNVNADLTAWSTAYQSVVSANNFKGVNKFYDPLQVINGQDEHTITWAVLDALDENGDVITANGNYYVSEREETLAFTDYEYGWWSKVKSDASGNFTVPQKIYLSFDPIYANYIDLYSSTKYGRIKAGSFRFRDADTGTWTSVNFNLSNSSYIYSIGQTKHIDAIELTINSTLYPYDVARVQEFAPRWIEDISARVVSLEISKNRENFDSSVPLGATGANTCNIVLDNTDLELNPDNTGSSYYGTITPGIKFKIGYNYHTSSGIELLDQGYFYSDNWSIDSDNMTVSVSCRDFSAKMQDATVVDGYLASDITASEAISDLALRSGVPLSKLDIDKNYVSTVLADKPAVFWRLNETSMQQKSLYFNGSTYLYSHPFGDLWAGGAGDGSVSGTQKNTTVASKKVLPRTFYDFPASECTVEFWIKCGSDARNKTILNYATKRFANEFRVSIGSDGRLVTKIQNFAPGQAEPSDASTGFFSDSAIDDNIWHHIAIVVDPALSSAGSGVGVQYYIDGSTGVAAQLAGFTFQPFRPSGQMLIGAGFNAGGIASNVATGPHTLNKTSSIFIGHLREIKIWATTRTQAQIIDGMNKPFNQQKINAYSNYVYKNLILSDNPCGYWPLDIRNSSLHNGTFIRDISGFDRNGTQAGTGITSYEGPIKNEDSSRALHFNSTGVINVSNTTITPFEGTSSTLNATNPVASQYDFSLFSSSLSTEANFSLEFWIKPLAAPLARRCIVSKFESTGLNQEWAAYLTTDLKIQFDVLNTSAAVITTLTSNNAISLSQWSHIVIVASGARLQIFVNGQASNQTFLATGAYALSNLDATLRIGNTPSTPANLNSVLAHVAIYKRALSIESIYKHYIKAGYDDQNVSYENTGRLLCHWPLNQGKFYAYEDLSQDGYAYTASGRRKENIVPNVTKEGNYLFAYTSNTSNSPLSQAMWYSTGAMALKDHAGNHYASLRLGASPNYDEKDVSNYITYNTGSPISSEIEKSITLNNTTSTVKNLGYINHMDDCPMRADILNSFTVEFWFKSSNVSHKQYLFSRENFGSTVTGGTWRIFLDSDGVLKFEIYRFDNNPPYSIIPTGLRSTLTSNTWYHVATTVKVLGSNYILTIYVNGAAYAQYTWATAIAALVENYVKTIIGGHGLTTSNALIGSISNIAIYNYELNLSTVLNHYKRGISLYQYVYSSIGAAGDSYWAEMLKIATADIGMFYFDENDNFVYEHGRSYDDVIDSQHSDVQYEINDGNLISIGSSVTYGITGGLRTYPGLYPVAGTSSYGQYGGATDSTAAIVSGSQTVELQVNKVIVKVYPPLSTTIAKTGIWAAEGNTSLAICTLASNLSATSTDSISLSLTLNPAGIYEPLWPDSGIVKIDNEFIRYKKSTGNTLYDLERGYWGSIAQSHVAGAKVGEAREFSLEWGSSPVYFVSYPFITGIIFDDTVVASNWRFNGLNGYIRLYPSDSVVPSNKYVVLEGNNPVTKLDNYFRVAGIVMSNQQKNKQNIVEISENYKDNIRRYGEKVLEIDNPLIQDAQYAKDLAQYLLQKYALPVPILEVSTIGLPHLQLGDRIKINTFDRLSILNGEYWIMSINMSYNGGIEQKMTLRKVS